MANKLKVKESFDDEFDYGPEEDEFDADSFDVETSPTLDENDFSEEDDPLYGYGEDDGEDFSYGDMLDDMSNGSDEDEYFGEVETDEELAAEEDEALFAGEDDYGFDNYDDFENGAEFDDLGSDSMGYSSDELDSRDHDYDAVSGFEDVYDDDHFAESKNHHNKNHIQESDNSKKTRKALQFINEAAKILKSVNAEKFNEEISVLTDIHSNIKRM